MKTFKRILAFSLMALGLMTVGCSKDSGSSNNNRYYMSGASCIDSQTGFQTNQSYCYNNVNNNGRYYMNGNMCYDRQTGYQVNQSLCYNNSGGYGYGQQCIGYYTWNGQTRYCSGYDCAGWQLIDQRTGQTVYCQ